MLADIITQNTRGKMALQDLYQLLKVRFSDHFSDDGEDDTKSGSGGGWRVSLRFVEC
jgi:hypothetical protein